MPATTSTKGPTISSLPEQSIFSYLYGVTVDSNALETYLKTITIAGAADKIKFMYNDPKIRDVNVPVKFTAVTATQAYTRIGNKDYGAFLTKTSGLTLQLPVAASKTPLNYSVYAAFPPNILSVPLLLATSTSPNFNIPARVFVELNDFGGSTSMFFVVRFTDGSSALHAPPAAISTVSGVAQYGGDNSMFTPSGATSSGEDPFSKITSLMNSNSKPLTGGRRKQKYTRKNRR